VFSVLTENPLRRFGGAHLCRVPMLRLEGLEAATNRVHLRPFCLVVIQETKTNAAAHLLSIRKVNQTHHGWFKESGGI